MKFLLAQLFSLILIQYVIQSEGSSIRTTVKPKVAGSTAPSAVAPKKKGISLKQRMAKLNMVRATMPVLPSAPQLTKAEIDKIEEEDKKASFGGPVSGQTKQSKTAGKVAIGARIIKGQSAHRGQFPWQVGIIVDEENFCGGALISRHHVLTAGHCTYNQKSFELVFGAQNRSAEESGSLGMISTKAVTHRGYKESTLKNDIAIIFLPRAVEENEYIRTIRLPRRIQANRFMKKGTPVQVAGWGRTTDGSMDISDNLKTIKLSMMTSVDCIKSYGRSSFGATNLCAAGKNGDATCQGDSGGGLVYKDPTDNTYTQVGLVSYGAAEGCETGYPEVFTKVASYLGWISSVTGLAV